MYFMNIYRIWQEVNDNYDTYDSAIVIAKDETSARLISPDAYCYLTKDNKCWFTYVDGQVEECSPLSWVRFNDVKVELIGTALPNAKAGLVLTSFNAG